MNQLEFSQRYKEIVNPEASHHEIRAAWEAEEKRQQREAEEKRQQREAQREAEEKRQQREAEEKRQQHLQAIIENPNVAEDQRRKAMDALCESKRQAAEPAQAALSGEELLARLKHDGLVPSALPPPKRLSDDLAGRTLTLVNRQQAINKIGEVTSARFENFKEGKRTKELHPHLTAFAAAGTGKSRLAEEGLNLLQQADLPPELQQALCTKGGSLAVHVSFNGDTKFHEMDTKSMDAALASRFLASYFGCDWSSLQLSPIYRQLSTTAAIKCIVLDHRGRHQLAPDQLILLYLTVDDAGATLVDDAQEGWLSDRQNRHNRRHLKTISNGLGKILMEVPDQATFPVSILTGTTYKAMEEVMSIDSSHPFRQLEVPLLPVEACRQIFLDLGWESWADARECQQLLADVGGIPRIVDFLCGQIRSEIDASHDPNSADWEKVEKEVTREAHRRYRAPDNVSLSQAVLKAALTRVPVSGDATVANTTWETLQRGGHIFLEDTGAKESVYTVAVPYMLLQHHVRNHLSQLPPAAALLFNMPAAELFEWQTWEKFNVLYEAVLASLYARDGPRRITVGEFYRGALVQPDIAGLEFDLQGDVEYVQCKERFPETQPPRSRDTEEELAWDTGSFAVLNAGGAIMDGFAGSPAPSGTVLRCQEEKWLKDLDRDTISLQDINTIVTKVRDAVAESLPSVQPVIGIFTVKDAEPPDLMASALPPSCVFVGRRQLLDFYGSTFAPRAWLGGRSRSTVDHPSRRFSTSAPRVNGSSDPAVSASTGFPPDSRGFSAPPSGFRDLAYSAAGRVALSGLSAPPISLPAGLWRSSDIPRGTATGFLARAHLGQLAVRTVKHLR